MKLSVSRFEHERDHAQWDALCRAAPMTSFLHTRAFLSYHGDRFQDESCIVRDEHGHLIAAMSAARLPGRPDIVCTHPGSSFGGLIHAGNLLGEQLVRVLALICAQFRDDGFASLRYKLTPHIYHRWPAEDEIYALWRLGAMPYRYDLSSSVDLSARREPGSRRRRALRTARAAHLAIHDEMARVDAFWPVLSANLAERHGAKPVHSIDEMRLLMSRFPDEIALVTGEMNGSVEAGVLLFISPRVCHAQYIACSPTGREVNALDALFEHSIDIATQRGCRYFDFGISNEDEGRHLNAGLYQFKSEFGGGGSVHAFYELFFDQQFSERCDAILRS